MIKDKTIYFGYGDILVQGRLHGITFKSFNPSQEIGCDLTDIEDGLEFLDEIKIELRLKEATKLQDDLRNIYNNQIVKVQDYILDFTNFNDRSVVVVQNVVSGFIKNYMRLSAC